MIKTRKVGFGVILVFLSAISHLFSTMNMYYLPTLKKPLKEKKKKTIGRRGGFFTLREDLFKLFSHREGPKLSLCLQSPSQCCKGGKKNLPKCQNPVSGSLLLQGPSGAKPSFLLTAWPEAPRVAGCPCSQQHWRRRQQGHLCQMVDTLSSGLETLGSNGKWPETTQGQHWYFKRLGGWRGRRNHLFKRKKKP